MTAVVITVNSVAHATVESTTSSQSVLLVRHVAAAADNTREVKASVQLREYRIHGEVRRWDSDR
jgi:ribosomal protein S4E